MIICQQCGRENPDGAEFCTQCGTYVRWTDQRVPARAGCTARLTLTEITVVPGAQAQLTLEVRNTGSIVDGFEIRLLPGAPRWIGVEPAQVRLFPNATGSVHLQLSPPRDPSAGAGPLVVAVRIASLSESDVGTEVAAQVTVAPYSALSAEMVPRESEGSATLSATHRVEVTNLGNAPADARVTAADPNGRLWFRVQPDALHLEAGATGVASVTVWSRQPLAEPQPQQRPFEVVVEAARQASIRLPGAMLDRPVQPLALRLVPREAQGSTAASALYRLEITNTERSPVDVQVTAWDQDERLLFAVQPAAVRVEGGATASVQLTVWPRYRLDQPPAQAHPFEVHAAVPNLPATAATGSFVQEPFQDLTVRLVPREAEGSPRAPAVFRIEVSNLGNDAADVSVAFVDPDERLRAQVQPASLRLDPGGTRVAQLRVWPAASAGEGPAQPRTFGVLARSPGRPPATADGSFVQQPVAPAPEARRRRRWPVLLPLLMVGLLALADSLSGAGPLPSLQASSQGGSGGPQVGKLDVTATVRDFGTVPVGQAGPASIVTVTNSGGGPAAITDQLAGANRDDFKIVSDDCNGATEAPAHRCQLQVAFQPKSQGPKVSTLTVGTGGQTSASLTLTGTGRGVAAITFDPATLSITLAVTATDGVGVLTVANTGSGGVTISRLQVAGTPGFSVRASTCSVLAPGGGSCKVTVGYHAGVLPASGDLQVFDDAPGSPQTVPLSAARCSGRFCVILPPPQ